jgi:hypothetical protein
MTNKEKVEAILKKKTDDVTPEEMDFVYANIDFQTLLDQAMENITNGNEVQIDDETIKNHIKE